MPPMESARVSDREGKTERGGDVERDKESDKRHIVEFEGYHFMKTFHCSESF